MHYERDKIRDITAPILNEEAKKHGDELDFCDLRWGINTGDLDTEEGSKKVLDVCLDEIDRSEPPMVVLLGYRYGWIPDADLIKTAAARKRLELDELQRSVTALEIEYGALCDEKKFRNTLFYFREIEGDAPSDYLAEDKEHEEKISALKNRIKNITGGKVKEYTLKWNGSGFDGVDAFARMLAEDIKDMLMPEWKKTENLTDFQRERRTHATFIREKNIMFRARQVEAEKLMKDALSQPVTIIKGEVGSGKSTLFSHMVTELEKTEWTVLPFISGLTMESNSARDIIENTVYFIEEELHLDHYIDETDSQSSDISPDIGDGEDEAPRRTDKKKKHTPDEWRDKLAKMCSAYAKSGKRLLIMLDAADQLAPDEERDKLHFIPLSVSEDIHFVMTCTTDFGTPGREYDTLRQLNDEDKQDVIDGILARNGRELSKPVINDMLKLKASDNPLYLSLLVQRLLMMNSDDFADIRSRGDGMAAIEQHQLKLIENQCPDDLNEMSAALLGEAGKRINEKLVSKAAEYLAVSRSGLRRKDLAALLGEEWTEIDFSHFVNYMYDCFLLRDDGRYDFTHKSIRAGFRRQCEDFDGVNRNILEYFKSLEANDPVRAGEIIFHTIKADDKKFFAEYIVEYKFDSNIINHAVRDTHAQCIADNGQWIIDVLNAAKNYETDGKLYYLTNFCNLMLINAFSGSQKELEINLSIMTANADLSERLYNRLKTIDSKRELSTSYNNVAGIYEELGGSDNLQLALELYGKALTINEQLAAELSTPLGTTHSKSDLSTSYNNVAGIYEKLGGSDNLQLALELYGKALTTREQLAAKLGNAQSKRDLSISYHHVAEIYATLDGSDNLQLALEFYGKALTISEQLAAELGTAHSKSDLSISYINVAGIYEKLGGSDNLQLALELYGKALTINKQLTAELGNAQNKRNLTISYGRVAGIYEKLGGSDNLQLALELYGKALTIREQLAAELGTAQSKRELSISYHNVAGIYEKLGGSHNLQFALELYGKYLTISEQLAAELGNAQSKRELSISYHRVAGIYAALGGSHNLQLALELYGKGLTISEQLAAELATADSKENLAASYHKIAEIYKKLGGSNNLGHALELYHRTLAILEQLATELATANSKKNLAVGYHKIAEIYEELGGSDNLQQALELYRKGHVIFAQLAKELDTADSKRNLAISSEGVAGIYEKLGGNENLEHARELYDKGFSIKQQLAEELDTAQSKRDLSVSHMNVAGIFEKVGGDENLAQALELYRKALEIREQLANTLQTVDAYDDLAVCLLKISKHSSTTTPDKKALLTRSLEISKDLYEKTNLDKYKAYIEECEELLQE